MWSFSQRTGIVGIDGIYVGRGYAGYRQGKGNPDMQDVHNIGPIPQGLWEIGPAHDTLSHGPLVLSLTPAANTNTFGRTGFLIHGDSIQFPGDASHGCVVLARPIRQQIADSGDTQLEVTV